jgi:hypothetical protein
MLNFYQIKKLLIWLAIGGGVLYLYYNSRNKKAKELADATALKEKISALQGKIGSAVKSGGLVRVNADNKSDTNQAWLDKLTKTIDANLMSVDELQKVSDGIDAYMGSYVGTKTKQQIGNEMNEVLDKYQITK